MLSTLRKRSSGFTLLELIIVVIVIGILASIALPRYLRVAEKARVADAKSILGAIRASQMRYAAQYSAYSTVLDSLDLPSSSWTASKYFTAAVPAAAQATNVDASAVAYVTRTATEAVAGIGSGYVLTIQQGGTINISGNLTNLL